MKMTGAWVVAVGLLAGVGAPAQFGTFSGMGMGFRSTDVRPQQIAFRPWVRLSASYWDNLSVIEEGSSSINSLGNSYGAMMGWGVSGGKSMDRSAYAMSYIGSARYVSNRSKVGGLSNIGNFAYFSQFSKELSWSTNVYGGESSGGYGLSGGFGGLGGLGFTGLGMMSPLSPGGISSFADSSTEGLAEDEIFDNRIYIGGLRSVLTYSPNYRWQIGGGVLGTTTHRTGDGLFDMNAVGGFGQAAYMVDRTTSVTAGYTYTRIWFPGVIAQNSLHSTMAGLNKAISRRTMISVGGGLTRFSSAGAAEVPLDPLIAELLGSGSTIELKKTDRNIFNFGARVNHVIADQLSVTGRYMRGVSPGNGLLLASVRDLASGSINYAMSERWSFGLGISGTRSVAILQEGKDYLNAQGMGSVAYLMGKGMHITSSGGYRIGRLPNGIYQRQAFASLGIAWAPGGGPMRWF